jgi:hydroxyquinol 1,2-dioxygenase
VAAGDAAARTDPAEITRKAISSFEGASDARLLELMQSLVRHLHGFAAEVGLTHDEWQAAIEVLTATGRITDEKRQEFILWSDVLGLSMFVDALGHPLPEGATESTVLGPFYVPGSPLRAYGADIAEQEAGIPAFVHGCVLDAISGEPIAGAEIDVWQNGDNRLYAVQDPDAPDEHLRGRFRAREDGSYAYRAVRPLPYPIPADGPVGRMLDATGRHPWRPAHIHMVVRAPGYQTLVTHIFDRASEYLDSDTVFAVKSSLLRTFEERDADDPDKPGAFDGPWCSLECTILLAPVYAAEPADPGRTA